MQYKGRITRENAFWDNKTVCKGISKRTGKSSGRDYDISDAIGVMISEMEIGNVITFEDIQNAYTKLYNDKLSEELMNQMKLICNMNLEELKSYYGKQNTSEQEMGEKIVTYIDEGANINTHNVDEVIAKIKEKLIKQ